MKNIDKSKKCQIEIFSG